MTPYLARLDHELRRRGVPAGRRRQLLHELRDHIHDLTDEGGAMTDATIEAKMGEPAAVAAAADREYRRCGWAARRPWLAFGLLPLPVFLLCWVGTVFGTVGLCWAAEAAGWEPSRAALNRFAVGFADGMRFVPPLLATVLVVRWAARHRPAWGWVAAGVGQVALFAGSLVSHVVTGDEPGSSTYVLIPVALSGLMGLDPLAVLGRHLLPLAVQAAAPVAAAVALLRLARRPAAA